MVANAFPQRKGPTGPPNSDAPEQVIVQPLAWTIYVDPDNAGSSLPGTPNGSIAYPFLTIQDAFDVLANSGFDRGTIIVCQANISTNGSAGSLVIPNEMSFFSLSIRGEGASSKSLERGGSIGFGEGGRIDSIVVGGDGAGALIDILNISIVLGAGIVAQGGDGIDPTPTNVQLVGCVCTNIDINDGRVMGDNSTLRDIAADEIYVTNSYINGNGANWTATTIEVDGFTAKNLALTGSTTSSFPGIIERAQRATIAVTIPSLAAGELAYVDVNVSGTGLAPVDVGDCIIANPQSDLNAAGVDGGFLASVSVTALNTIRVAFVGEINLGGPPDILFAKV